MRFFLLAALIAVAAAKVHFSERFDSSYSSRWVTSNWKKSEGTSGEWAHVAGPYHGDAEEDKGIQTSQDARFYAISSAIAEPFSNNGKTLVFQFQVRFPQSIDCGGGYVKLLPTLDQAGFNGDSDYSIMFGPDICGTTKRTHFILNYKGKNHLIKREIRAETDKISHVYTMILNPDNTYEVRIDGVKAQSGSLSDDWDLLAPKTIKDPAQSKPADWVDEAMIDDPADTKPEGYDNIVKTIADPAAAKPADWDDEADGAWEAPQIDNPEYKGEWRAKRIANPAYKGAWVHPEIANPDYVEDPNLHSFAKIGYVGIELWQVKAGTIFDNIIVTDDIVEAENLMAETYTKNIALEKKMLEDADKAAADKAAADRAAAEASKPAEPEAKEEEAEEAKEENVHDEL